MGSASPDRGGQPRGFSFFWGRQARAREAVQCRCARGAWIKVCFDRAAEGRSQAFECRRQLRNGPHSQDAEVRFIPHLQMPIPAGPGDHTQATYFKTICATQVGLITLSS